MPLLDDIMDNKVLGREFRRGLEQGLERGLEQGRHDGEVALLLRQVERRFGVAPRGLQDRLARMSDSELESVGVRLLEAQSLGELLPGL
jgi:hypothetical protein